LLDFIVKNKVNNQLFLEIMKDGVQNAAQPNVEDEIKNKLAQLGIKPDRRNMETAFKPNLHLCIRLVKADIFDAADHITVNADCFCLRRTYGVGYVDNNFIFFNILYNIVILVTVKA